MDDTLLCPICGDKLRNAYFDSIRTPTIEKYSEFIKRSCDRGYNHRLAFFFDKNTGRIDWIEVSLASDYSRWVEINFLNEKCRISCFKEGKPEYINIDKLLEPDFPYLIKLKEKINLYVVFS